MAKRQTKTQEPQERQIPIEWVFPEDLTSGYATNILVQIGQNEFFISFFEMSPPVIMNAADLDTIESVQAYCIARIIVTPDRLNEFIAVLQKQLNLYNEKKVGEAEQKLNGVK